MRLDYRCTEDMMLNLTKNTGQLLTLNRQHFTPSLIYRGTVLQHNDVSTYLGFILDSKLKWSKHVEQYRCYIESCKQTFILVDWQDLIGDTVEKT